MSIGDAIKENTINAASKDPRFPPVSRDELQNIKIEISILSQAQSIKNSDDIEIGKHGVILRHGPANSVFLPQVPIEQNWDLQEYLENLSIKAGLNRSAWEQADLSIFTVRKFEE